MKLHSQEVRALAPENDPLKIGMGWSVSDLGKPQIFVESTFGDSHPGSAHLDQFVKQAALHRGMTASTPRCLTATRSSTWWRRKPTPASTMGAYLLPAVTSPYPPC